MVSGDVLLYWYMEERKDLSAVVYAAIMVFVYLIAS